VERFGLFELDDVVHTSEVNPQFPPPPKLAIVVTENPFACDGTFRVFGALSGAQPGETIAFTSTRPDVIMNGPADASGNQQLRWECPAGRTGPVTLRAVGQSSGRSGSADFREFTPPPLTMTFVENPFHCDSNFRHFADLSGALPGETLNYTSNPPEQLLPGTADAQGNHPMQWECAPAYAGQVTLTVVGATSHKSVTITFLTVAP
jgi:hypothetical protein